MVDLGLALSLLAAWASGAEREGRAPQGALPSFRFQVDVSHLTAPYRGRVLNSTTLQASARLSGNSRLRWTRSAHHAVGRDRDNRFNAVQQELAWVQGPFEVAYGWSGWGEARRPQSKLQYRGPRELRFRAEWGKLVGGTAAVGTGRIEVPSRSVWWLEADWSAEFANAGPWATDLRAALTFELPQGLRRSEPSLRLGIQVEARYAVSPRTELYGQVAALPFGAPFSSRLFPSVSQFGLYEPGGFVGELRRNPLLSLELGVRIRF
ncbi:MAG TPA: hypothetical protein PLO61_05220 [Fimbriimonadaceae bacterium]|nr:hypothetical protein [Fimbriimonadaceae bacterium]HRJ33088.1 hypothetical protein [Fimbriimonadaceae bacterium]